jgi:two-component system, sensor histidine kinase and response regulator
VGRSGFGVSITEIARGLEIQEEANLDSNTTRILLVDDDEINRRMMGLLLSEKGYNYDTASNGIEAIEAVKSRSYGIVLMDLQMPLMDGFEATSKIREWEAQNQHVPIVALTAMLLDDEIQKCLSVGMDECIAKPFNSEVLFKLIETYMSNLNQIASKEDLRKSAIVEKLVMLDVDEALPRFSMDVEMYREFLSEFIDNLPQRIDQFQTAFLSGEFKLLANNAHNLKGISASLGAMQLSYLSQKLDQICMDGDPFVIQQALKVLEKHIHTFQNEAMNILSGFIGQHER